MSPSVEARVAAATAKLATQRASKEDNEAQIRAGTADLDAYRIYTDEIKNTERWLLARAPLLVALVSAGVWKWGADLPTAYPPDAELSEAVEGLASVVWGMAEHRREMGFKTYTWEDRRNDAILYLALGDDNATPLRQRIWINDGVRWSLSPEVIEAATTLLATSFPGDPLLYPDLRDATSHPTDPTTPPGRIDGRTWADAARAFEAQGWRDRHYGDWSDQVKSGQRS